jgi:hypothetical protein
VRQHEGVSVTTWEVGIEGEELDICEIEKLAAAFDCQVIRSADGRFLLVSDQFEDLADVAEVSGAAKRMLDRLDGVAKLNHSNHRPITLSGTVHVVAPGGNRGVVISIPPIEIRMRESLQFAITQADGTVENRNIEVSKLERATRIANDPMLTELIEVLSGEMNWQRLRVAFEKLSALVGKGDNALVKKGYATQVELTQFKANVQDPRHSGHDAVHGVPQGALKGNAMSKEEGLKFVKRLINTYIDRLV